MNYTRKGDKVMFEKMLLSYINSLAVYGLSYDYKKSKITMFIMSYPNAWDDKTPEKHLEEWIEADKFTLAG